MDKTDKDKKYFEELCKHRENIAKVLKEPCVEGGIKESVVNKYSDQAHFIYELLQNADDTKASKARFVLKKDYLIFAHNGLDFTISDPKNEKEDKENGKLGDINAITAIGNSNKTEASIGKFGIGFKAVFQYTDTPHIYSPNFKFKMVDLLSPVLLEDDNLERCPEETLFKFPFDCKKGYDTDPFSDVSTKLKSLIFPNLFLNNLKSIQFKIYYDSESYEDGCYKKTINNESKFENTNAKKISITKKCGNEIDNEDLWLFSRDDKDGYNYSVGYFLDGNHLKPKKYPAFCFFPTKEVTNLNFIVHSPFLLTDSREGIREGIPHNKNMIQLLAELAADSLLYLKEIGEEKSIRLIDDDILNIIPTDKNSFSSEWCKDRISFKPFYDEIKGVFSKEEILPSTDGYTDSNNAYWASVPPLPKLFSNKQLRQICNNENAKWVFVNLGRDEHKRTKPKLSEYIDSIVKTNLDDDAIINDIDECFIENQDIDWLHKFYKWISASKKDRTEMIKNKPVFLDMDKKAAAAYDGNKHPILFLPSDNIINVKTVLPILLENPETKKFIEQIGVQEPSKKDYIFNNILPLYKCEKKPNIKEHLKHFDLIYSCYLECPQDDLDKFKNLIKYSNIILCSALSSPENYEYAKADDIYILGDQSELFKNSSVKFVSIDKYEKFIDKKRGSKKDNRKKLTDFFNLLDIKEAKIKDYIYNVILPQYNFRRDFDELLYYLSVSCYGRIDDKDLWIFSRDEETGDPDIVVDEESADLAGEQFYSSSDGIYKIKYDMLKYDIIDNKYYYKISNVSNPPIEEHLKHIKIIYEYYCKRPLNEREDFIKDIKDYEIIMYSETGNSDKSQITYADKIYLPTEELKKFFTGNNDAKFVSIDKYNEFINKNTENPEGLEDFLKKLGVHDEPSYKFINYGDSTKRLNYGELLTNVSINKNLDIKKHTEEYTIDGLFSLISHISKEKDEDLSVFLWGLLCKFSCSQYWDYDRNHHTVLKRYVSSRRNVRSKFIDTEEESDTSKYLKSEPWLMDRKGNFVNASQLNSNTLSASYDLKIDGADNLLDILKIVNDTNTEELGVNDTDPEELGKRCRELGITWSDLNDTAKRKEAEKKREEEAHSSGLNPREALQKHDNVGINNIDDDDDDFPNSKITNGKRYSDNIMKRVKDTDKESPKEYTSIQKRTDNSKEREFLKSQYMGKCQICGEKIIDKNGKPVFVTHKLTKDLADKYKSENNLGWNSVCLCPNCHVKLDNCENNVSTSVLDFITESEIDDNDIDIPIMISGEKKKIHYSAKHKIRFKSVIDAYDKM